MEGEGQWLKDWILVIVLKEFSFNIRRLNIFQCVSIRRNSI